MIKYWQKRDEKGGLSAPRFSESDIYVGGALRIVGQVPVPEHLVQWRQLIVNVVAAHVSFKFNQIIFTLSF